jgi:hypothetical protein
MQLCAGNAGISACSGDSGGPLVALDRNGRAAVAGVVSWGPRACGTHVGVYTRVSGYDSWMRGVMGVAAPAPAPAAPPAAAPVPTPAPAPAPAAGGQWRVGGNELCVGVGDGRIARADNREWVTCSVTAGSRWVPVDVTAQRNTVKRLFKAYFLRDADVDGQDYWLWVHFNGANFSAISNAFTLSTEFQVMYGPLSDADFVRMIYRNVLRREADPAGLDYWYRTIVGRYASRGGVMLGFSESAEFKALTGITP